MVLLLRKKPGVFHPPPEALFLTPSISAYLLFFYTQGRAYAVTILCNFLVGMSQSVTPPTKVSIVTSVAFRNDDDGQDPGDNYVRPHASLRGVLITPIYVHRGTAGGTAWTWT
jgi:hypothetical protein